jgi:serine/threonine protein kinase
VSDLKCGTQFAGYRIDEVAGRGGMGIVYRATQLGLDRPVALKVIAGELLGDPRIRERFLRESRVAAAIEHPNVIPIYASGEEAGRAFIVMRFVDGDDLRERVAGSGPLAPGEAAAIVAQVAAALDAAHAAGLVHRDVKPANILLDAHDHAYLTDFGLARHALSDPGLTAPGGWVGTLDFIAPEQIRGEHVDGRADIYALGSVLHFALTGRVPYPRESDEARLWAHLHAAPPKPSAFEDVPAAFDEVVRRALAQRPADRHASAGDLAGTALDACSGITRSATQKRWPLVHKGRSTADTTTWPDATPARRSRATTGAVIAAAALGAGAAVLFADGGADHSPATSSTTRPAVTRSAASNIAPRTNAGAARTVHVAKSVRVAPRPISVEVAGGNAWVASTGASRLGRYSVHGMRRRHEPRLGPGVSDVVQRRGELWVAVAYTRQVFHLRAASGAQIGPPIDMVGAPRSIDAGEGAVWVGEQSSTGPDELAEIDPHTAKVVGRLAVAEGINDVRAADGAVWLVGRRQPDLIKVSPATRQPVARIPVGSAPLRVDAAAGYVWVTDFGDDTVSRIDPKGPTIATIGVPSRPYGVDARDDGVWVACYGDQSVVRIDPRSGRVTGNAIPVGFNPVGVHVGAGSVWVTSVADNRLTRIDL